MGEAVAAIVDHVSHSNLGYAYLVEAEHAVGVVDNVTNVPKLEDQEHHEMESFLLES